MKAQKSFLNDLPTLYLVATPIGNLEDMTFRAVRILQEVDVIYCEDTRVSSKLLHHFGIQKQLKQYHDHNKETQKDHIINDLQKGHNVALISDAGYPLISDPGYVIINEVITLGYNVVSIPGASAFLHALVVSGIAPHPFLFYGFLDAKESKRIKQLNQLVDYQETLVFYESPHRIQKTMHSIYQVMGERNVVIARELTKKYEEILRGTTSSMQELPDLKGEIVIVLEGKKEEAYTPTKSMEDEVEELIQNGYNSKEAIKLIAKLRNIPKNDVYQAYHQNKQK
jgi:16S rRNA (cytidine1402-2'-O)-methyltransferase